MDSNGGQGQTVTVTVRWRGRKHHPLAATGGKRRQVSSQLERFLDDGTGERVRGMQITRAQIDALSEGLT